MNISFITIQGNESSGWDVVNKKFPKFYGNKTVKLSITTTFDTTKDHYADKKTAEVAAAKMAELHALPFVSADTSVITVTPLSDCFLPVELTPSGGVIGQGTNSPSFSAAVAEAVAHAESKNLPFIDPQVLALSSRQAEEEKTEEKKITFNKYSELVFPKTIINYTTTLNYDSAEAEQQLIRIIAEHVSTIYTAFLTPEGHQQRDKDLSFSSYPRKFPSGEAVKKFKNILNDKMIKKLNERCEDFADVELSTDYGPERLLSNVLDESGISWNDSEVWKLFPIKTSTRIYNWNESKKIEIFMIP